MSVSVKFAKKQLARFSSLITNPSLSSARKHQETLGRIMSLTKRKTVSIEHIEGKVKYVTATPKEKRHEGIVLYLHGGGFVCGEDSYVEGASTFFAHKLGMKVFAPVYSLAPEHKFPKAPHDCLEAYKKLLSMGYVGKDILLLGESAGGGLVYSLCLLIKEAGLEMPSGILAVSPWVDLTLSGDSYDKNASLDASMTKERLEFFASSYTEDKKDPLASPLFADLTELPPSLIFVGGNEIMLDDAKRLCDRLSGFGAEASLVVADEMWHTYLMYDLSERASDFLEIDRFLNLVLPKTRLKLWLPLDNAAKIYPAARSKRWSNIFRLSATFFDEIDKDILAVALGVTVRRFPSIAVRLCKGAFWYYLEEIGNPPDIIDEFGHPTTNMSEKDTSKCAFRVLVYKKRVAVEFFHSITDGTGGMVFFKSLLAEYAERKYGVSVPCESGILDRYGDIDDGELEDSFVKNASDVSISRKESFAYHFRGTKETDGFINAVTFSVDVESIHALALERKVSITAFLTAVLMKAFMDLQDDSVKKRRRKKPIKIMLPVNLRNIFPSNTLRNFALYITPEITPSMGDYTFDEICRAVHHQMGTELNANRMRARITRNVSDERSFFIKIMPLFIKNAVMKGVFNAVGEKTCCTTMSNLGALKLPIELSQFISRFDFVLNVPSNTPHNCGVISYGDKMYINFVRNIKEPDVEYRFHKILRDMGVRLTVESNGGAERR